MVSLLFHQIFSLFLSLSLSQDLTSEEPTLSPLLFAVLPTNELVVIISGLEYDQYQGHRTLKDPVIFRQPLASMTTGGPVLQEGAGRLLAEVFPDLAGYFNDLGKHAAMGVVCFRGDQDQAVQDRKEPPQCLLFMQHGHEDGRDGASVVTFDLSSPGNSTGKACVRKAEYWPRTAVPIVPLSVDRPNQYLSYQSVAHAIYDRSVPFSGSLASTQVTAALPEAKACPDSDEANVTQAWTTVASYLCDYHGQDKFQLKEESCDRLAFNKPFSTGFVVTGGEEGREDLVKGIFLLPLFGSFPLLVLPLEVADHPANPALLGKACPLTWVGRADFWNKWNSFKPDNCGIEPSTTTGPSTTSTTATATGKSTTTTPNNVTASVDSTTGNSMLYIIIGVFVLVVILVLILITAICIWSKRGKSGQGKGGKGGGKGVKEDKSVSRATSSAVSSKVPSKVAASKVSSKVGGKAAPSKMTAKESSTKEQLKAVPSKSVAGGKAPSALKVGSKVAPGSTFQTSAVA